MKLTPWQKRRNKRQAEISNKAAMTSIPNNEVQPMSEEIKVIWHGSAKESEFIFSGLLQRSYERFLSNNRKDVVSEYMGGQIIVVTTQTDGKCWQLALWRKEIDTLPSDCLALLQKQLKIPGKKSVFGMELR